LARTSREISQPIQALAGGARKIFAPRIIHSEDSGSAAPARACAALSENANNILNNKDNIAAYKLISATKPHMQNSLSRSFYKLCTCLSTDNVENLKSLSARQS
jgi:hypothetical protein